MRSAQDRCGRGGGVVHIYLGTYVTICMNLCRYANNTSVICTALYVFLNMY